MSGGSEENGEAYGSAAFKGFCLLRTRPAAATTELKDLAVTSEPLFPRTHQGARTSLCRDLILGKEEVAGLCRVSVPEGLELQPWAFPCERLMPLILRVTGKELLKVSMTAEAT